MDKLPITALVQTLNESRSIVRCIEGLDAFSEVIVVDSGSDDGTQELALGVGAKVVNFTWNGQYPKKKQWQLDNVATVNDWVLFVDADEVPSVALVDELRAMIPTLTSDQFAAADIRLSYCFAGTFLRFGHRVVKRALVRRHRVSFPAVDDLGFPGMGELEGHYQPTAAGEVLQLRSRLIHDDVDPVRTWFDRHNQYSDWEAHLRVDGISRRAVSSGRSRQGRIFDRVPCKPLVFFVYSFVVRLGFLDGRAGLDYALALAGYYWQIGLKIRELRRSVTVGPAPPLDAKPSS